ncbi:hypothetical protein OTB20_22855 [Streptomyces sp. H27-H1]|uniref:hypothetical protein n=1 Tax=Streptomyces sp. H27-H1 TaxID=2996461 RepID=UPI00226E9C6A|nr:hypothetical protein [Streptomyces sp. H27-H1]MCY0928995.1 hypothetical protein [Streptomyces sp. H27-H1]
MGTPGPAAAIPLHVETLCRAVHHAWRLFQSSAAFTSLSGRMPALLADATQAAARHQGDDRSPPTAPCR